MLVLVTYSLMCLFVFFLAIIGSNVRKKHGVNLQLFMHFLGAELRRVTKLKLAKI